MSDDKLAAALDEIRERWAQVEHVVLKPEVVPEVGPVPDYLSYAPRLLAALDAVLDLVREWEQNPSVTYRHVTQSLQASIAYGLLGEDGSDD